jgi:hypothetical protein
MNQHPDVYMKSGECHFFDDKEFTEAGIRDYESGFSTIKRFIGEKTPAYCYLRYSIDRIHKYNPNMKLIMILREPISRSYSQYNMNNRGNLDNFLTSVVKEKDVELKHITKRAPHNIVRGYYDEQLDYILSKFPKENIYIGIAEEIRKNKQEEYNKIFAFLGTKDRIRINEECDTHIRSYNKPISKEDAKVLYDIYKPHNERLYALLGRPITAWEDYYKTLI